MIWEFFVVVLRNIVILFGVIMNVDVGCFKSKWVVDEVQVVDCWVLLLMQCDFCIDDFICVELFDMGVLVVVKQVVWMFDNIYQVFVEVQEWVCVMDEVLSVYMCVCVDIQSVIELQGEQVCVIGVFVSEVKLVFEDYQCQNKNLCLDNY